MLRLILFNLLLFGSCGYALAKGTRDARIIAWTALVASFASLAGVENYGSVEAVVLSIDLLVLAIFGYVALTSDRFWPLWVCGLHMTTMFGHLFRATSQEFVPLAYAVALRMWTYPQLVILAIAVWRSVQRQRAATPPSHLSI